MGKKRTLLVYLAALAYATITGLSFVFTKIALEYSDPINMLAHRFLISFIVLFIILVATKKLSYFNLSTFIKVLPLAVAYPVLFFTLQTFGLQYVDSSFGGIMMALIPVGTLILSRIFLKRKSNLVQVLFVVIAVSGMAFIFFNTSRNSSVDDINPIGLILLLFCALSFSAYTILAENFTTKYESLELLTVMITVGAILFNVFALIRGGINNNISDYYKSFLNSDYIVAVLYLGILSTLVSSMLTNYVLTYLEATKMSVFSNLSSLISIAAGALILGEKVYYYHIVGATLIIVGVLGVNFSGNKVKKT